MTIDGVPYFWQYNINESIDKYKVYYFTKTFCKLIPHGFKYNYYLENSQFIWSCLLYSSEWLSPNATIFAISANLYDGEVCQQLEEAGLIRGRDYWGWSDFVKNLFVLYWQGVLGRTGSNRIIQRELTHVKGEGKIIRFDICSEECSKV